MKGRIIILASVVALLSSGCVSKRKKLILPAAPRVAVAKPLPEVEIETPPEIETSMPLADVWMPEMPAEPEMENPPPKPVQRTKPQPRTPPVATTPEVQPSAPVVPPPPVPRLGEILTDDRRREYEAEFTGYMTLARTAVNRASASASRHPLNATQRDRIVQIKEFLRQAEGWKTKDLATALLLARRADLLGQDLLKSLQ